MIRQVESSINQLVFYLPAWADSVLEAGHGTNTEFVLEQTVRVTYEAFQVDLLES